MREMNDDTEKIEYLEIVKSRSDTVEKPTHNINSQL